MWSRSFVGLYVAVFVATMGISMVSPLLPVYARELGASGVWLGLTFSVFAIVQTFVGPFAGRLSDRYGRKPFIVAGLLIYLVSALGYLTASSFYQVIAFRAFSGLGTSLIFSVARAYVGDMTPKGQEGRWLGVFATADIIGFGTGPLVAGVFREFIGFRSVFVAMAAMMALSATFLLFWLPRHSPQEVIRRAERKLHGAPLTVSFATQDITGGLAQPIFGRMADTYSRRALVAVGLLLNAALLACVGIVPSYGLMVVVLMSMGAAGAISQVASGAIQVVAGRRGGMGTVLGIGSASNGAGIVIGSVVSGLIVDSQGIAAAFFFGGAVMAAGVAVSLFLPRGLVTKEVDAPPPIAAEGAIEAAAGS